MMTAGEDGETGCFPPTGATLAETLAGEQQCCRYRPKVEVHQRPAANIFAALHVQEKLNFLKCR